MLQTKAEGDLLENYLLLQEANFFVEATFLDLRLGKRVKEREGKSGKSHSLFSLSVLKI